MTQTAHLNLSQFVAPSGEFKHCEMDIKIEYLYQRPLHMVLHCCLINHYLF